MPEVPGHQIISLGSLGALQESVVFLIRHFSKNQRGLDQLCGLPNCGYCAASVNWINLKTRTGEHHAVFSQDWLRDVLCKCLFLYEKCACTFKSRKKNFTEVVYTNQSYGP